MSKREPDDESGKMHFFKIDTKGEIVSTAPKETLKDPLPPAAIDPQLTAEIKTLKTQVDSITRLPRSNRLNSDQLDTLYRYIEIKDTESHDLRSQNRHFTKLITQINQKLDQLDQANRGMETELQSLRQRNQILEAEHASLGDRHKEELRALHSEYEDRLRSASTYDSLKEDLERKQNEWKERVASDLRRIKLKEKELEDRYEFLRRDTQALLDAKDKHMLELKTQLNQLELDKESLEERVLRDSHMFNSVQAKKKRLVETLRLAQQLLIEIDVIDAQKEPQKKAG